MSPGLRRVVSALAMVVAIPCTALAQDTFRRVELGGTAAIGTVTQPGFRSPGLGGWIDVSLTRSLAIEARVLRLREALLSPSTTISMGIRATLVRAPSFNIYGLALPGMSTLVTNHFVLDLGAGLEIAPRSRFVVRIEGNRDLNARRHGDRDLIVDLESGTITTSIVPLPIASRWNLLVGASYHFGPVMAESPARMTTRRWVIGPQTGVTASTGGVWTGTAGAFAGYRLTSWCDLDASVSGFLASSVAPSLFEGGRQVQAVGGVKLGVRDGRFGAFFKVRAGVNHDSTVADFTLGSSYVGRTMPVLDIGGVVEAALSPRAILRIDLGESLAFSRIPAPNWPFGSPKIYSLPISLGLGWRF